MGAGPQRFLFLFLFCFVTGLAAWAYLYGTAAECFSELSLEAEIQATVTPTRASVPAALVADATCASSTQWCRHLAVKMKSPRRSRTDFPERQLRLI